MEDFPHPGLQLGVGADGGVAGVIELHQALHEPATGQRGTKSHGERAGGTGDHKGSQGITRDHRDHEGSQGITRDHKGSQGS